MPKERPNLAQKLRDLVAMFPDFEMVDNLLRCKYCSDRIQYDSKRGTTPFTRHLKSQKHQKKSMEGIPVRLFNNEPETAVCMTVNEVSNNNTNCLNNLNEATVKQEYFNKRLRTALIEANIPFFKLKHPSFRSFLEEFTKFKIPDESTLRKPIAKMKSNSMIKTEPET